MAHEDDCPIHGEAVPPGDPRYDGFRAQALWAVMGVDPHDDQEGVVSVPEPKGGYRPLIATDERAVDHIKFWASLLRRAGDETRMTLVKFETRIDVEVL